MGAAIWAMPGIVSASSMLLGRPWTMAVARRRQPHELWNTPLFREANQVVTGVWTLYFAIAAAVCAVTPTWACAVLGAPTIVLGLTSNRIGTSYVARQLARASRDGS